MAEARSGHPASFPNLSEGRLRRKLGLGDTQLELGACLEFERPTIPTSRECSEFDHWDFNRDADLT